MVKQELGLSSRFQKKLRESEKWQMNVNQVYSNVKDYFYCTPKFFPEYTHHGICHVNKTLELCDRLIPDEALTEISSRELGILIIAAIMHDIGMFIDEEGLKNILCGTASESKTELLDKYTWKEEWNRYYHGILRYSDKKMQRIFGMADSPEQLLGELGEITHNNILIYGEFLRRNHGRLSYEIIRDGFPGRETMDVLRNTEIDEEIRDLIALVARSHGMRLRDTFNYLEEQYMMPTEPKNIKIYYLMAVLRMADYLDAGYDRAPHVIEVMKTIHSAISEEEFSWNQAIDFEDYDWRTKSETLIIHANPVCSDQFLKIESWLLELQKELDLCWAVLGESYSGNSVLGLAIRRINSNILEEKTRKNFERRFVTKRAVLDTNPDILKLLIYPLYNEESKYGVRELLQNAIDACNEREEIERKKGNDKYQPQIYVEIDYDQDEFRITDNGLGMTEDVIINYFLVSGASFRNSEFWEDKFVQDGKSRVARTGKFGIGVLSAFLLGSYVEVITRSVYERLGYSFKIEMGRDNINIERKDVPIGTTLVIHSTKEILNEVVQGTKYPRWNDWYCFQKPSVKYILNGKEVYHIEEYVPNAEEEFDGWHQLEGTEFASYKWSYAAKQLLGINVFCNGIPVVQGTELDAWKYGFPLNPPTLSIVDYDNEVHINLSRDRLTDFPSEAIFIKEGYKFVIMRLLEVKTIKGFQSCGEALQEGFPYCKEFSVVGRSMVRLSRYVFNKNGYTLMSPAFLKHAGVKKLNLVCIESHKLKNFKVNTSEIPIWLCEMGAFRRRSFFLRIFASIFEREEIKEEVIQFMFEKNFYDIELKNHFEEQGICDRIEYQKEKNDAYNFIVSREKVDENEKIIETDSFEKNGILAVIQFQLEYEDTTNLMQNLLQEYLETTEWIPYDFEERKAVCRKAFEELKKYAGE